MRYYSKLRIGLYAMILALSVFVGKIGYAAAAPDEAASAATAARTNAGVFDIIMKNIDAVFIIIAILSVTGLTLIIQGFIKIRREVLMPESSVSHIRELIAQKQFRELLEFTESDPSFISQALSPALKRAPSFTAMKEAMETSIGEQTADQFRRIEYLNIIGNLGPLLGLLGTVWGMIDAFQGMSEAQGAADPKVLSGGISKALAHTFLGLMLALPCLAAFGVLRTLVDRLTIHAALVAEELLLMTRPQELKPATAVGARPATAGAAAAPPVPPPPAARKAAVPPPAAS